MQWSINFKIGTRFWSRHQFWVNSSKIKVTQAHKCICIHLWIQVHLYPRLCRVVLSLNINVNV